MTDNEAYEARIKAVARVIMDRAINRDWEDASDMDREFCLKLARAADAATLKAIAEPTTRMRVAACATEVISLPSAHRVYQAMHAAIPRGDG